MSELAHFLKSLLSVSGISGFETTAAQLVREKWAPLADEVSITRLGSLQAGKRGTASEPRPSVMIAAHMDSVGMMVSRVVEGFLHITQIGDLDPRVLPGTPVIVHGRKDIPAVIVTPPSELLPGVRRGEVVALEHLLVDTGQTPREVARSIRVGDLVSFATLPVGMAGDLISGHSLDNRASVAALTVCLEELQSRAHEWDVWAVATAQEEINFGGAATSSYALKPDLAVAVDTTYGRAPGTDGWDAFPIGGGPTLGIGPNIHPYLLRRFRELAENLDIAYALEPMPTSSGTDGMALQVSGAGIPTMVVSIPIRYMHTAAEMVAIRDIQRTGRLLAEFIGSLEADFLKKVIWDA